MTVSEYRRYYLDLTLGVLGGNHGHFDIVERTDEQRAAYNNFLKGLTVLALVSLIEANFLSKTEMKAIRNFQTIPRLPKSIHQIHLSSFIYLRDCFAHNPFAKLLPPGSNTTAFLAAISNGAFSFASITGQDIKINETRPLHLTVLRFFGENV